MNKNLQKLMAISFWVVAWWVVAKVANSFLVPSPEETVKAIYQIIVKAGFIKAVSYSLFRILTGFLLSFLFGFLLGLLAALSEKIDHFLNPIITVFKSIPVISLILIILFYASSSMTPMVVCMLMCLPIVYNSVYDGIKNVEIKLLKMAKLYKLSFFDTIKSIYFPSIRPFLFTAAKSSLNLGFRVTVAAEVLSSPKFGLGARMFDAKVYLEIAELFAWTVVVILLSYLFEWTLKYLIKKYSIKGDKQNAADQKS